MSPEIALQDKSTPATSDSVSTDETDDNGMARDPDVTIKRLRTRLGMSGDHVHDSASDIDSDLEADGPEGSEIMSLLRTICDTVKNTRCLKQLQETQATAQLSRYGDVNCF